MHLRKGVIGSRHQKMQLHWRPLSQRHIDIEGMDRTLLMLRFHIHNEAFHWLYQAQLQDSGAIYSCHPIESHNSNLVAAWS